MTSNVSKSYLGYLNNLKAPRFRVGDTVTVTKYKNSFSTDYNEN